MTMAGFMYFPSGVISIWLCTISSILSATAEVTTMPYNQTTTAIPGPFYIEIVSKRRQPSAISVEWSVAEGYTVLEYVVQSRRQDSKAVTHTKLSPDTQEYTIEDLKSNSEYKVCVEATIDNDTRMDSEIKCENMKTIPLIRDDSLIALFCVIAYILLIIIIAYICMRYAQKKAEQEKAAKEAEEGEAEEEKLNPTANQPQYLEPPDKPYRSSIEEEDIPYITPPFTQLSKEEQDQFNSVAV